MTRTLESAARDYIVGKFRREDLIAFADRTPTGSEDELRALIQQQGGVDQSTDQGLKAALRRHFGEA